MGCEENSGFEVTLPGFDEAYGFESKGEAQNAFRTKVAEAAKAARQKSGKACKGDCDGEKRCRMFIDEDNFESLDKHIYFSYEDDDGDFAWGYSKLGAGLTINTGCKCVPKKKRKK